MDIVAAGLELDPVELRRVNFRRGSAERGDLGDVLDRLVEKAGVGSLREQQRRRRAKGELFGIGVATAVDVFPGNSHRWESATVRVLPSGNVEILTGVCPGGRGLDDSYSLIAGGVIGVPPADIRVRRGDTACGPPGTGSPGGRVVPVGGVAVHEAARCVESKMRRIAALILGVAEDYVQHAEGFFLAGDVTVSFEEVCHYAYYADALPPGEFPGLEATRVFQPDVPAVSFGGHLCVVSVDRETGDVRVERHFAVHDFGRVIHAPSVESKVQRGIGRGLELAFCERVGPEDEVHELIGAPSRANALGAKGIGVLPVACSLAAAANAVMDALRAEGIRHVDLPLCAGNVWLALAREAGREEGGAP